MPEHWNVSARQWELSGVGGNMHPLRLALAYCIDRNPPRRQTRRVYYDPPAND
jgi:hypothetical protein